jgi:hypothetical protein
MADLDRRLLTQPCMIADGTPSLVAGSQPSFPLLVRAVSQLSESVPSRSLWETGIGSRRPPAFSPCRSWNLAPILCFVFLLLHSHSLLAVACPDLRGTMFPPGCPSVPRVTCHQNQIVRSFSSGDKLGSCATEMRIVFLFLKKNEDANC